MDRMIMWSPGVTLEAIEKQVVLKAFQFYRGNKTATANSLGIAVRTLDAKLEKYAADGKAEKERQDNGQQARNELLARMRGPKTPNNITTGADLNPPKSAETKGGDDSASAGVRVESASQAAAQQAVPVSQRKEVQGMLPKNSPASHPGKSR